MRFLKMLSLTFILLPGLFAQAPPAGDEYWPKEIDTDDLHLVLYQPQVDSWKGNRIEARSAVIVTLKGHPTQIFGTVSISARTEVDKETRLVSLEDINVKEANFPSASSLQGNLRKAVRESVSSWPHTVSLDRLLADLSITQTETKAETVRLKNEPPRIIFSKEPAVLILIEGDPVYRAVEGTPYTRVVNTPALLLFNSAAETFYLDGGSGWMTASSLTGPWTAAANPPPDLAEIKRQLTKEEEKEPSAVTTAPPGNPPVVYVSLVPAELLVTQGDPAYAPIAETSLLYATNSDDDIFVHTQSQKYYTLLAGRWFRAKSLEGPWEWVAGEQLPGDFTKIPPDSPKGHVLASIPGTEEAREAVIANQIPQTATVRRSEAKLDVKYDGPPQFQPIEGTGMEYAINTSAEVIHAAGRYYAVQHGVWFVADSALGPWAVADMIPAEIYTIPPSCPLYHVRYVYVYGATPEVCVCWLYARLHGGLCLRWRGGVRHRLVVSGMVRRLSTVLLFWLAVDLGIRIPIQLLGRRLVLAAGGHYWWYHNTPVSHRIFSEHWNMQRRHSQPGMDSWQRERLQSLGRERRRGAQFRSSPEGSHRRAVAHVRTYTGGGMGTFISIAPMAGISRISPGSGKKHLRIQDLSSSANPAH